MTDPHHATPAGARPPAPLHELEQITDAVNGLQSQVNTEVGELRALMDQIRADAALPPDVVAAMDRVTACAQAMADGADRMTAAARAARAETN